MIFALLLVSFHNYVYCEGIRQHLKYFFYEWCKKNMDLRSLMVFYPCMKMRSLIKSVLLPFRTCIVFHTKPWCSHSKHQDEQCSGYHSTLKKKRPENRNNYKASVYVASRSACVCVEGVTRLYHLVFYVATTNDEEGALAYKKTVSSL